MKTMPVIVVGGGGHAKVVIAALQATGIEVAGVTDLDVSRHGDSILGARIMGDDSWLHRTYAPDTVQLANGIGSTRQLALRAVVFQRFSERGYMFVSVRHPTAVVAADAVVEVGAQIMAGAVVQPGTTIGVNTIVNTRAGVDHDCIVGGHVHIAPGATLSGGVRIGEGSHIGAGATVIQGIVIGNNCMVAAGAAVIHDVPDNVVVAGVPARPLHSNPASGAGRR